MPRKSRDVNKSEEIRQLLTSSPEMPVKDIVGTLRGRGIKVATNLVYFIKGKMPARIDVDGKHARWWHASPRPGTAIRWPRSEK
jgi:hypothetical protein